MNHPNASSGPRPTKSTLCRYFSSNGYCFYGDQCQFVHAKPSPNDAHARPVEKNYSMAGGHMNNSSYMHRSMSTPNFSTHGMSNGPSGNKGHRNLSHKSNTLATSTVPENYISNLAGLSISTSKVPHAFGHGNHGPHSPTKKHFSSLAPGGPVSPMHSPKSSLGSPPKPKPQLPGQAFEFLPNTANQPPAQQQAPSGGHQAQPYEAGGTMYFIDPQHSQQQSAVLLPSYHAFMAEPSHLVHLQSNQTRNNAFSMSAQLRQELVTQHTLSMAQLDPDDPSVPQEVDNYHTLCPIEPLDTPTDQAQRTFGFMTTCYKAVGSKDGIFYLLRRIHGFRVINTKSVTLVDQWKKISHSNLVSLREVFTTKAFGDNSLVFVYDYHPGAETLLSRHFSGPDSTLPINPDGSLMFPANPRPGMSGGLGARHRPGGLMPERLIWSYIIQLSSALRVVHSAGLACRVIDPSKILMIGNSRLRINGCGIFDVLSFDGSNSPNAMVPHFQQEDLMSLGKLVLALACYSLQAVQREHVQQAMDHVAMNYSKDLQQLVLCLLGPPPQTHMKSINDIMPMIGARFYTQLDAAQVKSDVLEGELAKEMENSRLFRLVCKLGTINERPEFSMDSSWSETGDRYLLKLFRDYLFHQVSDTGAPWLDLAHIVSCLNKLDAGSLEKVCLVSRDEQSVLVVSYRDLKNCFIAAFNELMSASVA